MHVAMAVQVRAHFDCLLQGALKHCIKVRCSWCSSTVTKMRCVWLRRQLVHMSDQPRAIAYGCFLERLRNQDLMGCKFQQASEMGGTVFQSWQMGVGIVVSDLRSAQLTCERMID